jgi:pSer/pThr/pTyr-binding forkhead associated (FHA) protein
LPNVLKRQCFWCIIADSGGIGGFSVDVNIVLLKKDGGGGKIFQLPAAITIIGRRPDCDLCIPLKEISRRHCELELRSGLLKLRDLGSSNGTYLNGQKIEQEAEINTGDTIKIGPITFSIQINGKHRCVDDAKVDIGTDADVKAEHDFASLDELEFENLGGASGTIQI